MWHPLAYIAGGGIALRWFRDQFFNVLRGQPAGTGGRSLQPMIAEAPEIPPGADGLFFSPHLGGRICPAAPEMRGAWLGFSWGHTQAHFIRAVLESVAYEYAYYLGILRKLIPDLDLIEARVVGGGARSPVWNQIKADVLGVPYRALQGSEFGTWGARDDRGESGRDLRQSRRGCRGARSPGWENHQTEFERPYALPGDRCEDILPGRRCSKKAIPDPALKWIGRQVFERAVRNAKYD